MDSELLRVGPGIVSNAHFDCIIPTELYRCQKAIIGKIYQDPRDIEYFETGFKCLFLEK